MVTGPENVNPKTRRAICTAAAIPAGWSLMTPLETWATGYAVTGHPPVLVQQAKQRRNLSYPWRLALQVDRLMEHYSAFQRPVNHFSNRLPGQLWMEIETILGCLGPRLAWGNVKNL
jgi:hypothetical protein